MTESEFEAKTTVFDREHAVYTMESYVEKETGDIGHHELSIKEKDSDGLLSTTFMVLDDGCDVEGIILNTEKKLQLIKLLDEFTQEMEGYSYYGSNPGIPEDEIEVLVEVRRAVYMQPLLSARSSVNLHQSNHPG